MENEQEPTISLISRKGHLRRLREGNSFSAFIRRAKKGEYPASAGGHLDDIHKDYCVLDNVRFENFIGNASLYNSGFIKKSDFQQGEDLDCAIGKKGRVSFIVHLHGNSLKIVPPLLRKQKPRSRLSWFFLGR